MAGTPGECKIIYVPFPLVSFENMRVVFQPFMCFSKIGVHVISVRYLEKQDKRG